MESKGIIVDSVDLSIYSLSRFITPNRSGFTLIELLIVIGIISLLIQMALPAVQAAREAARKISCTNNLRQIGIALQNYESAHKELPTGGWGWAWIGDPDRGYGKNQPGGWSYQLLPYLEQETVHDIGLGADAASKPELIATLASTPVETFYCPTRRAPVSTPTQNPQVRSDLQPDTGELFWYNSTFPELCARSDYVANNGDRFAPWTAGPTPKDAEELGNKAFQWQPILPKAEQGGHRRNFRDFNGIVVQRHPVKFSYITDGLSKTYFVMEKRIVSWGYDSGRVANDNQSAWSGSAWDVASSTYWPPSKDPVEKRGYKNLVDLWGEGEVASDERDRIGSAHAAGSNAVFCDGSVHFVSYDIEPVVHRNYGNRNGGSIEIVP